MVWILTYSSCLFHCTFKSCKRCPQTTKQEDYFFRFLGCCAVAPQSSFLIDNQCLLTLLTYWKLQTAVNKREMLLINFCYGQVMGGPVDLCNFTHHESMKRINVGVWRHRWNERCKQGNRFTSSLKQQEYNVDAEKFNQWSYMTTLLTTGLPYQSVKRHWRSMSLMWYWRQGLHNLGAAGKISKRKNGKTLLGNINEYHARE
jgi:hypothetical protein